MFEIDNLEKVPNREGHMCFGCGSANTAGLKMKFSSDGEAVYARLKIPTHLCGWDRLAHGGVIATILDEAMGWAGVRLLRRYVMTKSMTVDFLKSVYVGDTIEVKGEVLERINDKNATLQSLIYNHKNQLCAQSTGSYALLNFKLAKRLKLMSETTEKYFKPLIDE